MAKIEWTDDAKIEFKKYVKNAQLEFGTSTAQKWQTERKVIEWRLERYPVSYSIEELLQGRSILYRFCHLMHRRFKVIYYYDEAEDTIHVVDIWDTRMNPKALIKRIK